MRLVLARLGVLAVTVISAPAWANLSPDTGRTAIDADLIVGFTATPSVIRGSGPEQHRLEVIAALTEHNCGRSHDGPSLSLGIGGGVGCSNEVDWVFPDATNTAGTIILNGVIRSGFDDEESDDANFGIDIQSLIRSSVGSLKLLGNDSIDASDMNVIERTITVRLSAVESGHPSSVAAKAPVSGTLALFGIGLVVLGLLGWWLRKTFRAA